MQNRTNIILSYCKRIFLVIFCASSKNTLESFLVQESFLVFCVYCWFFCMISVWVNGKFKDVSFCNYSTIFIYSFRVCHVSNCSIFDNGISFSNYTVLSLCYLLHCIGLYQIHVASESIFTAINSSLLWVSIYWFYKWLYHFFNKCILIVANKNSASRPTNIIVIYSINYLFTVTNTFHVPRTNPFLVIKKYSTEHQPCY